MHEAHPNSWHPVGGLRTLVRHLLHSGGISGRREVHARSPFIYLRHQLLASRYGEFQPNLPLPLAPYSYSRFSARKC